MASQAVLVFILTAITVTNGWLLNVNKGTTVDIGVTTNLNLRCDNSDYDQYPFTLEGISLMKMKGNGWDRVATLDDTEGAVLSSLSDAVVEAKLDGWSNTFLEARFRVATDESVGQFMCVVFGVDTLFGDEKMTKTLPLMIKRKKLSKYEQLLKSIMELKKGNDNVDELKSDVRMLKKKVDDISHASLNNTEMLRQLLEPQQNGDLLKALKNVVDILMDHANKTISHRMDEIKDELSVAVKNVSDRQVLMRSRINQLSSKVDNLKCCSSKTKNEKDGKADNAAWPEGHYLIPRPDTGCPNNSNSVWQRAFVRISSGPADENKDAVSTNLNLAGNVLQNIRTNSYVRLEACSLLSSSGQRNEWPSGMYCIQGYKYNHDNYDDRYCPKGFHWGESRFGRFDDGTKDMVQNMDVVTKDDETYIPFCCRQDGSFNEEISLPTGSPFFLYRYGGTCQQVEDMKVSKQFVQLGTGRWSQGNYFYSEDNNIYHPDGSADESSYDSQNRGARIELCYYTKRE